MWNFASDCVAGNSGLKNDFLKHTLDCSDDEVSSGASREEGLECPICWESFNIVENVPYVLWCGHTLCKNCIIGLKWAVVKFPTLPVQLPLFISCPWCNLLSLRLVYRGNLKFPRKNYFLLWMVERMNGDRGKSHPVYSGDHNAGWPSNTKLALESRESHFSIRRGHRSESSGSNHGHIDVDNYLGVESIHSSLWKSLVFFVNLTTKFPLALKDSIWLFEQEQALGFSSVSTNIRMTVIKLKSGGLWVHAPIAPTKECIQLVKELGAPVEYIVLPTFAYEHKIFVGPFSRKFPRAQIWVAPRQWSWPLNLPLEFFGIFGAKTLKDEDFASPWVDEIEQKVLSSPEVGIGPYVEVAFYHKRSRTLLVTDAVIFVPRQPPDCISNKSLLASAKNGLAVKILSKGKEVPEEPVVDNKMNRQKGWERMVLQILFLGPSNLLEPNSSFAKMSQKLIVSPIVKTLVFSKVPEKVKDWIDSIARDWRFKRIIPAHFSAPINASRSDFLAAFAFLDDFLDDRYITRPSLSLLLASIMGKAASYFPPDDMKTLSSLDQFLVSVGAVKKTVSGRKR